VRQAIKEMVLMPLLYPEVFTQLGVTPPRGVLFHGPPGTGKTLVARALAQSCCGAGQHVHFFMRKGADILSKWCVLFCFFVYPSYHTSNCPILNISQRYPKEIGRANKNSK